MSVSPDRKAGRLKEDTMEANANLEQAKKDWEKYINTPDHCYRALPKANIVFGSWGGEGHESVETPLFINIIGVVVDPATKSPDLKGGQEVRLSIGLAPYQMAEIVKFFFHDVIMEKKVYGKFLLRLLRKRWSLMTCSTAKRPIHEDESGWYSGMQYANLKPWA